MKPFVVNHYNYILFSSVIAWAVAQVLKTILFFFFKKEFSFERLFGAGGMPSAHSATVSSATFASYRLLGFSSPVFASLAIISIIVIYDATGVRHQAGLHAKEINRINAILEQNSENLIINKIKFNESRKLKEFLGHTPLEAFFGVLLGIIVALLVPMK